MSSSSFVFDIVRYLGDYRQYLPAYFANRKVVLTLNGSNRLALIRTNTMSFIYEVFYCGIDEEGYWYIVANKTPYYLFKTISAKERIKDCDINAPLLCAPVVEDNNGYSEFYTFKNGHFTNNAFRIDKDCTEEGISNFTVDVLTFATLIEVGRDTRGFSDRFRTAICTQIIKVEDLMGNNFRFALSYATSVRMRMVFVNDLSPFVDLRYKEKKFTFETNLKLNRAEKIAASICTGSVLDMAQISILAENLAKFVRVYFSEDFYSIYQILRSIIRLIISMYILMARHYRVDDFISKITISGIEEHNFYPATIDSDSGSQLNFGIIRCISDPY
jgi:hypothetical protein